MAVTAVLTQFPHINISFIPINHIIPKENLLNFLMKAGATKFLKTTASAPSLIIHMYLTKYNILLTLPNAFNYLNMACNQYIFFIIFFFRQSQCILNNKLREEENRNKSISTGSKLCKG